MKHDGSLPLIGVNTFVNPNEVDDHKLELARSTDAEKQSQIKRLAAFQLNNQSESVEALQRLKNAAINNDNVFAELMHAVRYCSLGQITETFFQGGGQYRRSM